MLLDGQVSLLDDPAGRSVVQAEQLGATSLSWFVSPPFVAGIFAPLAALPYPASAAGFGQQFLQEHWCSPFIALKP